MKPDVLRRNIAAASRIAVALTLFALPSFAQDEDSEAAPAQQGGHYEARPDGQSESSETEEAPSPIQQQPAARPRTVPRVFRARPGGIHAEPNQETSPPGVQDGGRMGGPGATQGAADGRIRQAPSSIFSGRPPASQANGSGSGGYTCMAAGGLKESYSSVAEIIADAKRVNFTHAIVVDGSQVYPGFGPALPCASASAEAVSGTPGASQTGLRRPWACGGKGDDAYEQRPNTPKLDRSYRQADIDATNGHPDISVHGYIVSPQGEIVAPSWLTPDVQRKWLNANIPYAPSKILGQNDQGYGCGKASGTLQDAVNKALEISGHP